MSSNLKVNTILPSTGDTVSIAGIASITSSVSIASSCTATTFYGSGANLTGITQTTINNNAANRIITGEGGTTLNGEANLTFDGSTLGLSGVFNSGGNVNCTSGRFQRGSATVQDGDAIAGGININGTDMDASVIMSVFGNDNDFTRISGSKSRNASVGSHTIVQDNDVLLSLKGFGSDGTNFEEAAQIEMQVDGTPNNNVMPGRIVFKTTTTDGVAERLRINSTGNMSLGGIDPVPTSTSYNTASFHIHQTTNASNVGAQVHLTTANKGSAAGDGAQISQYNGNLYINNQDDGNMYFLNNSNSTIRMTITSGGALGFAGANYGTAGQVLKSGGSGAAPTWGDAGGLTTEIYAYISFGTTYDTNSGYVVQDISSLQSGNGITVNNSNERVTPTVAGKYLFMYMCNWLWSFSGGATFYNRITKNGSEQQRSTFSKYDPGSHTNITMCVITMNGSSDYVQFEGYENKSGQAAYMGNLSRAVMFKLRD